MCCRDIDEIVADDVMPIDKFLAAGNVVVAKNGR
jgi:hypothetical protein